MKPIINILAALFLLLSYGYTIISFNISSRLIKKMKAQQIEGGECRFTAIQKASLPDLDAKAKTALLLKLSVQIIYVFLGLTICLLILTARDF
jgi:hypothetical protein